MKPTIKAKQAITFHRDGSVSYFSIYCQQWLRTPIWTLIGMPHDFLALSAADRSQISHRAAKRGGAS